MAVIETDKFEKAEFCYKLSKLIKNLELSEKRIEENPWPLIRELEKRNAEYLDLFYEIKHELYPLPKMVSNTEVPELLDPRTEAIAILSKTRKVIDESGVI